MNARDEAGATPPKPPLAYLWTGLAVITCPCHILILVVVLSGTAFGAFLSEHFGVALLGVTILFFVFAAAAVRSWKGSEELRR